MIKFLLIFIWPAGIGVILAIAALAVRRDPGRLSAGRLLGWPQRWVSRHGGSWSPARRTMIAFAVLAAGLIVTGGVMVLIGLAAVHGGPAIDKPIFRFLAAHHREHLWKSLMRETTQFGYKWTTWGAAVTAGVFLVFLRKEHRWLPPAALGALIIVDHFLQRVITHIVHRVPPPGSGGTFPSGGCERVIVFYGLIAYFLWREVSRHRSGGIWAAAVVAALGFNESYSRTYLGMHWFTDTLGGLLFGCLELAVLIAAAEVIMGPAGLRPASRAKHASISDRGQVPVPRYPRPVRTAQPSSRESAG